MESKSFKSGEDSPIDDEYGHINKKNRIDPDIEGEPNNKNSMFAHTELDNLTNTQIITIALNH